MRALWKTKRGRKSHPHNECSRCCENDSENKGREKQMAKKEISTQLYEVAQEAQGG